MNQVTKKSYAIACSNTSECNTAIGLVCPFTTDTCNCPNTSSTIFCDCPRTQNNEFYWNGVSCVSSKSFNQSCTDEITSYMCKTLTQGTVCNGTGATFTCQCPYGQYFDTLSGKCTSVLAYNQSCSSSITCDTLLGLTCILGACR